MRVNSKTIFKKTEEEIAFERDGFVIVDILGIEEIMKLRKLYDTYFENKEDGLYVTLNQSSIQQSLEIHQKIGKIIHKSFESVFKDFNYVLNHFIAKSNVRSEEMRLHQDWSIVDECSVQAAHIWCALQDTSADNGGLFLIKKSHTFFDNFRSGSMGITFIDRNEIINKHLVAPMLKLGQAVVYKQSLFHGSFANHSLLPRVVILSSIKHKDADWLYFDRDKLSKKKVNAYKMNPKLFLEQLPELQKGNMLVTEQPNYSFLNEQFETSNIDANLFLHKLKESTVSFK